MGEVVNLRLARKQKARTERERAAQEARALHGRGKAEKQSAAAARDKAVSFLDGHRRDPRQAPVSEPDGTD